MTFQRSLAEGKVGEGKIAAWLRSRGWSVLPVYEIEKSTGKGPQLFTPFESLIAPDMIAYKSSKALWIEAKHKTAFSWYRARQIWTTGIDLRHYQQYQQVAKESPWPVWLLFLHQGGCAKDSPPSPSGLYGGLIEELAKLENHRSDRWANGMVYWNRDDLRYIATLEEVLHAYGERMAA